VTLTWLLEAQDDLSTQDSISQDVTTVKEQFQKHEVLQGLHIIMHRTDGLYWTPNPNPSPVTLTWLLEAQDDLSTQDSISQDVTTVKEQFQKHEVP